MKGKTNLTSIFQILSLILLQLLLSGCVANPTPMIITVAPTSIIVPTATISTTTTIPTATPVPSHVIVIDPGHGGDDWGTFHTDSTGKLDLLEKNITLQLGMQTAELLRAKGFKVVLTRTADVAPNSPPRDLNADDIIDENDDLQARINLANQSKAQLFFSIHINGSDLGNEVGGIETWYCRDRPFAKQNELFAESIQKETIASLQSIGYSAQNRRVEDDLNLENNGEHIFVLGPLNQDRKTATNMPGALTETLFISNDTEAALLADTKVINALSLGYSEAIENFFN